MSELQHRLDVRARGLARLIQQFRGKPRIIALLGIYLDEFQELADSRYDVHTKCSIENGEGVQLDGEGEINGEARQGVSDADYRPFLRARIRANFSNASVAEFVTILKLIFGDAVVVSAREFYPCTVRMWPKAAFAVSVRRVFGLLDKASMGGTSMRLVYSYADPANTLIGGWSQGGAALLPSQCGGYSGVLGIGGGVGAGVLA